MNRQSQRGISTLGFMGIVAIAGFFLLAAFKLGPLYIDNYFVKAALNSLVDEDVHGMSNGQVRRKLSNYFTVNNVRDIDRDAIKIERDRTRTLVRVEYEKRVDFMGNVDVVVSFNNIFDSSDP